jgi:glucose 1-dehydrogenase
MSHAACVGMAGRLAGKVAIVTGSSGGIGRAIARCFARDGAAVGINYHSHPQGAEALVAEIEQAGGKAICTQADVSKADDVRKLVDRTVQKFGRLDVMVNNAGIEHQMPFVDMPLALFEATIAVNLTGVWLGCQEAATRMIGQGQGGRIINISSVHEEITMPGNAAYCASKGGVMMLMRTIAVELAPHKITVNNIGPGAVDTPIDAATKTDPEKYAALLREIPLARMGQPEEIGELATFLASDAAAYITGGTYFIDGGLMRFSGSL